MVPRQQVIDYISSNIRSGYDIPSIRSRLIASGYEPAEISAAIDVVKSGKTSVTTRSHTHMFVTLGIAMVAFMLIATTALVFFQQGSDSPLGSVISGSSLDKPSTTTQKPTTSGSSTTNKPSTTPTTSKPASNSGSTTGSSNFQGTTNVRDTIPSIDYGTGASQSTLTTRLAIENKVNQLASSKPDEAVTLCDQINTVAGKYSCINTVAQVSEQSKYCTLISDVDSADACLTSLALKEVESVELCKQITSEIRFRQCVSIYNYQTQLETVQKAAIEVEALALADAPVPTNEQMIDAYTVPFAESTSTTVTGTTTTQTTTQTEQTVEETPQEEVIVDPSQETS